MVDAFRVEVDNPPNAVRLFAVKVPVNMVE
jgi:hypothetical protein